MKIPLGYLAWSLVAITGSAAAAKEEALQYQFATGQTNVYSVEISVRSEAGTDVTTGLVSVVTEEVHGDFARISCRTDLRSQMRRQPRWTSGGGYDPVSYGGMGNNNSPNGFEVELNHRGQEWRDTGARVLPAPLGKLIQSLFEPLPAKSDDKGVPTTVAIMDGPAWLGPAENFQNFRFNGSSSYYPGSASRNMPGLLYLTRKNTLSFKNGEDHKNLVTWHRRSEFKSGIKVGDGPEFIATTESDFTFDRNAGLLTEIDTAGDAVSQTEMSSRKVQVSFKARLLTGDELASALAPPVPTQPIAPTPARILTGADLDKVRQDLKSDDLDTRRGAIRQLSLAKVENPPDELVSAVAALAMDRDMYVQATAASFLAEHATAAQVPVLLKLLRGTDWSSRQNVVKALGRLKDPAAIQPLVDVLAANPSMAQMDLNNALIQFGPAAEPAVLKLFVEKNTETRRQACVILQQIGTTNSLPALENLAGDPDQSLSQAAADTIRLIKIRLD